MKFNFLPRIVNKLINGILICEYLFLFLFGNYTRFISFPRHWNNNTMGLIKFHSNEQLIIR